MIATDEWFNPTRMSGIAAYSIALCCCCIAWVGGSRVHRLPKLTVALTAIEAGLLLDIIFDWRWALHRRLIRFAQHFHEYSVRGTPQVIAVAILAGLLFFGAFSAMRIFRARTGAILAVLGALLSLVSWCVEVVSLHAMDQILYHPVGNIMVISFIWVMASLTTSIGVLLDARQAGAERRGLIVR